MRARLDLRTGRRLALADLFPPDWEEPLREAGERRLREERGMEPDRSFEEEGFWFDGDRFVLPVQLSVRADGLFFAWNPYDVAPYSMGAPSLLVPFADVAALLRDDGPLWSARHALGAPSRPPPETTGDRSRRRAWPGRQIGPFADPAAPGRASGHPHARQSDERAPGAPERHRRRPHRAA